MPARNVKVLRVAHEALKEWADWSLRYIEMSSIGYSGRTAEGRAMAEPLLVQDSAGFSSRCPEVMMGPRCSKVDHAFRDMPAMYRYVVRLKYLEPGVDADKIARFREETGNGRNAFYSLLDQVLAWVAGRLV
jgi:hypothetical protein